MVTVMSFFNVWQGLTESSKSFILTDSCFISLDVLWWWKSTCVAEEKNVTPEYRRI